jgi:serine protease
MITVTEVFLLQNRKSSLPTLRRITMKKAALLCVMFSALLLLLCGAARGQDLSPSGGGSGDLDITSEHVRGEIVVDLKDGVPESAIQEMVRSQHIPLHYNSPVSKRARLMVANVGEENMKSVLGFLSHDPRVESAEPNYVYYALAEKSSSYPNDPLYKYQWHMEKIKVRGAWKYTTGANVIVAVIDTGVAYEDYKSFHRLEDLAQTKFVSPYNFVSRGTHANDDHAHGSHVAGTIAQSTNNGKGVAGIAFNASIMPLKVLSSSGMGRTSDIADAIKYAADNGAKVINMSLGGRMSSITMEEACRYAYNKGVTIVCAAGNEKSENISYPAAYKECIAVSSIRDDDQLAWYSNRGKNIDIAAPGGDTNVDQNGDGYKDGVLQNTIKIRNPEQEDYLLFQGTSMASPHVAGVAALIVSLGYSNPKVVEQILKKSARTKGIDDLKKGYGAGILDAEKAVYLAGFIDGLAKLLCAFMMTGLLLFWFRGAADETRMIISPLFVSGLIVGACGFFFLPSMGLDNLPWKHILLRGFPQWDIAVLGAQFHGNVLFYSALFPFVATFLFFGSRLLRVVAAGFSTGVAAHLAFTLVVRPAEIQFIPSIFFIDRLWLFANCILCLYFAYMLFRLYSGRAVKGEEL